MFHIQVRKMADELNNQPAGNNDDQLLNLADQLMAPNSKVPGGIGGFDVSPAPTAPAYRGAEDGDAGRPEPRKPAPRGEIPVIRTLRGDIQEYTQKNKTSYFDIVAAAQKKRPQFSAEWATSSPNLKTAVIGGGIIAILLIIIGGYFLFAKKQTPTALPAARPPIALIYADNENILEYAGDAKLFVESIQNSLRESQLTNEFTYLPAKTQVADAEVFLGPADFLRAAGINLPAKVEVALTAPFTFGIINALGKNEVALLFKAVDHDRALAALLDWEKTMPRDLAKLLPEGAGHDFDGFKFKDVVVKNQDARILTNLEGFHILAYAIFNKKVVVIASSKMALEVVLDKLIASPPNL